MQSFTITNHISQSEYTKLLFRLSYGRWYLRIMTGFAMLILLIMLGTSAGMLPDVGFTGTVYMVLPAYFLIGYPALILWWSRRQYSSNPRICQIVEYTFNEENIQVKGEDFDSRYSWNNVVKIKKTKDYLLLYQSRASAEFIRRDRLSAEEIDFIISRKKKKV